MAIVKMKKLKLMAVRSRKDELLTELAKLGCVEFSEIGTQILESEVADVVAREGSELMQVKAQYSSLTHAVDLLGRYAPQKSKLLSAKPELEGSVFLEDEGVAAALSHAAAVEAGDDRIKRLTAEESRQRSVIESLKPWLDLDMRLDTDGTQRAAVIMGTVNAKLPLSEIESAVAAATEEAEVFQVSEDKAARYLVIVAMREELPKVQEALRPMAFSASGLSGLNGTAAECTVEAQKALEKLASDKETVLASIISESAYRDDIKLAADKLSTKIALCEAEEKLYGTEKAVVMEGWMPAENEKELEAVFEKYDCAWETADPVESEYPEVPVKLKNNKFTNALNMVTDMYSLPAYGSLDPNPLMAPFFILFYGLMMADMGYGILMIAAAAVALKKIKPRAGSLSFCQLLLYGGISTFICGALTGGFFGNALEIIGQILGKPEGWGVLPCLFNPMKDSMLVLIGAMALGMIHLNAGLAINFVKQIKRGNVADAIWGEGALWVTLIGIILFVLKIGNIAGIPVVLVIGLVMVFYGGSRGAKGFGKVTSIFGTLYNQATGWFGDILSYSRIMALMLAGSVIATVFNTIGGIANNLIFFFVIFIIGHALNFALNLLGCYVHDLRLQCLEYFGKFYEDGGRAFNPLKIKTKYYNTIEQ